MFFCYVVSSVKYCFVFVVLSQKKEISLVVNIKKEAYLLVSDVLLVCCVSDIRIY